MRVTLLLFSLLPVPLSADPPAPPGRAGQGGTHWAFCTPRHVRPPEVRNAARVRTPVDAFILAGLEKAGLAPADPADRATLLRRVTFTLTGLPPTPEEVSAFLNDERPDAYERGVERLLASPHYGERWAQHWLDVVRWAESNGYELDATRPHAWRYRDWVVRACNDDKPFDAFVAEQLAGDLLAEGQTGARRADLLIAAGFNRCGQVHLVTGNIDPQIARQEVLTEMTTAVGFAFLGLTIGCARCHDHKFDPIPARDYYRLEAFFAAAQPKEYDISTPEERAAHAQLARDPKARIAALRKQVAAIDEPHRARLTKAKTEALEPPYREALATPMLKRTREQHKLAADAMILTKVAWDEILAVLGPFESVRRSILRGQIHDLEARLPPPPAQAWSLTSSSKVPPTHVLKRGDVKNRGEKVDPGYPTALVPACPPGDKQSRLALANWLTRPDHPLTARVMVNRVWQHHFGRGLVATPGDFGTRGEKPTHPELLDWLANEFVRRGWSVKELHRLIVLSDAFRRTSTVRDARAEKVDPDNKLLWRINRRRVDAEALRDGVLAVAGSLDRRLGGPMVRVPLEPEVYDLIFTEDEPDGLWPVTPDRRQHARRSLYLFRKRNVRLPLLEAFDQPDTLNSCPDRASSTFAPQALILLNGPFLQEQSRALAARLLRESSDPAELVRRAYLLALARPPRPQELALAQQFLADQARLLRRESPESAHALAVTDFCLALLNRNDFLYIR